ncbi:MAG TPA: bifunctional tRNA (5-methylaminomethyl-2-thiouridine)(34)-methyltransferase MnmD/FAD-dependent 5-carboxymethylaminomethyl-2-thiouridine(34) oxidoreductase MnmC, partial [Oceanospirillales bacterium]|nr:bifunctional tRNA (5-methylaminomethyl-2-thiouridine)(34)-methyltransferase MnmD/FAD-dependent 5-carboxymethylaminomethyl-2-thiouridine(34) oxidoreductase MnmC [Oceanospirillales bacterium]
FGRKRDMLAGEFALSCGPERPASHSALPWLNLPPLLPPGSDVVVVGAGLAGCSTARALAERGIRVTLLDGEGIASGASGNPQGGLYIKLAADDSAQHSGFYRQAYEYALNR